MEAEVVVEVEVEADLDRLDAADLPVIADEHALIKRPECTGNTRINAYVLMKLYKNVVYIILIQYLVN